MQKSLMNTSIKLSTPINCTTTKFIQNNCDVRRLYVFEQVIRPEVNIDLK